MGCARSTHGREEKIIQILVGKEGKGPLVRLRCRRKDNIKSMLKKYDVSFRTGVSWFRIGTSGGGGGGLLKTW
jgi:hypothetical protein